MRLYSNQESMGLDPEARIGVTERVGYGLGDFASNLMWGGIATFMILL